ncbi:hypothetical protein [Saccharothrix obliqua]|uniref:hypothetical protein n=1 Tax=Saccharothrix obliqua TaxID=2861747 RepID=UPI001C5F3F9F|nr:hypothetical protein [Saccharothrix obliqua]MBW4717281.1 hypothetical protein [Saccharothrix obliqua]
MTSELEQVGQCRVVDVVRDVVGRVAPEEVPVVDALAALDPGVVSRRVVRAGARREPLGFGLGDVAVVVTPVVWVAVEHIVTRLTDSAADSLVDRLRRLVRRRRAVEPVVVLPLSPEQLAEVRRKAVEIGVRRGLAVAEAEAIADAIVARLALGDEPE